MRNRALGFILAIAGLLLIGYAAFGPVSPSHAVIGTPGEVQWYPIAGVALFVCGIVLVVRDYKHRL